MGRGRRPGSAVAAPEAAFDGGPGAGALCRSYRARPRAQRLESVCGRPRAREHRPIHRRETEAP
ncbi:hypothetical protein, partial [Rothia kristinae]|uniref:hypothetical protein n=1 Tax=Rothia kristinae TaxID=37923 RepID=UPI001A9738C9